MAVSRDAVFYNAVNASLEGSFSKLAALKKKFSTWEKACKHLGISNPSWPEKEIDLILLEEESYPPLLREIVNPPFGLYVKGKLPKEGVHISIVGTRKSTEEGQRMGKQLGEALASKGMVIVSGLAFGMDKSAHEGALRAGGKTIAVLANGLRTVYPRSNANLAQEIISRGGALLSEYPPDSTPFPHRFLERNRIVSGLSRGIIVIEAPIESGSLVTARFALDQNRDVFVVPGPVRHPNYKGSHELIRSGATLITGPEHILQEYGLETKAQELPLATSEERVILDVLTREGKPMTTDLISERANMDVRDVNRILSFLLIKSTIKENGTGYSL